ncbi:hypothetical protein [Actinophytocola sp.]|uniref:hypothetical protein n=1 Tax=Actinophytocola sp. TaxID=1872138 RepID=UPI002DDCF72A|nr:hypothetical protein [Actinophytocola sp.]
MTDGDLRLLSAALDIPAAELRRDQDSFPAVLADPRVFEAILGERAVARAVPLQVSPFLLFAVVVHRAQRELASMSHVPERAGLRQKVPVFDTPQLADFLATPERRLFLIELLASFTRIASGRYPVRTRHGWRWRRFNELDPVRLAGLLEAVGEAERPGIYRRLGDVSLFLTGVFPDYAGDRALSPVDAARLVRIAGVSARDEHERMIATPAIELFELLGARWYRTAWQLAPVRTDRLATIVEVAERFRSARRVLNHLADHYLFPVINPRDT